MTIPQWSLLGFALWTLIVLIGTVGVYRWAHILTGKAPITAFPGGVPHGSDWYRRGVRAHANCIENLPVYAVIVTVATFAGAHGVLLDALAIVILVARIAQSIVHVTFEETSLAVSARFTLFAVQIACMLVMAGLVVVR